MSTAGDEEGSILPLIAGFGAICLALVLIVTAATSLYLERKRLFTVADAAALAAAESFDPGRAPRGPALASDQVEDAVSRYLTSAAPRIESLRIEHAAAIDSTSATVTLSAVWHPPVVSVFVPDGMRIEVTTTGRTVYF